MDSDSKGKVNPAFISEEVPPPTILIPDDITNGHSKATELNTDKPPQDIDAEANNGAQARQTWGSDLEFLMSCIALSVGLGNVWRFPFTALDNGGGAFLIPYIIVLFLVGKPIYYLEMLLGQFSSRGSVKVWDVVPIMRGVGYGQTFAVSSLATYYASLMALTLRFLIASFSKVLPWSYCREMWGDTCVDPSQEASDVPRPTGGSTPAELYFRDIILKEKDSIADGLGEPIWQLVITLGVSWLLIVLILIKGIRSSGKASYFLALFPYAVMIILLIRTVTLPGAGRGILFFITPKWEALLDPNVWYAAITQVFFSLAICFGNIVMYASYNRFNQNIYKDAMIVTTLDTFTSMLSGIVIFGILGNLAYETNAENITDVVRGGPGLAFISYPEAISKFTFVPQLFAVLFFVMLLVLGIGSNVAMVSCIMTVITDSFKIKEWKLACTLGVLGFAVGILYVTPGGQHILNMVDFFAVSFVVLCLAIVQLVGIGWVYGVKRFCKDIEFMIGLKTGLYWRICWGIITPILMGIILIYFIASIKPLEYNGVPYPAAAEIVGWCLWAFGVVQLPIWGIYTLSKQPKAKSCWQKFCNSFKPTDNWGPMDPATFEEYKKFIAQELPDNSDKGFFYRCYDNIFG